MKKEDITPALAALMSPEDQERFGLQAPVFKKETDWRWRTTRLERDEHRTFDQWLRLHNFRYSHSRTDKKTTANAGVPDFLVFRKLTPGMAQDAIIDCLCIDFKMKGNKMSSDQEEWERGVHGSVHILETALEAIKLTIEHFGL